MIGADHDARLTRPQQDDVRKAIDILNRVAKLRQDLLTTALTDSEGEDNLTADLMSLLGLESGS